MGGSRVTERLIALSCGGMAHASGALWLPVAQTALIADAHLGYGWAQRRRGELGPVLDGGAADALEALCAELQPQHLVFLGDLVHAPRPAQAERELIESTLRRLAARASLTLVKGNHDRRLERDFASLPLEIADSWVDSGFHAVHGDRLPDNADSFLVLGHLHPVLRFADAAGAAVCVRVFLEGERGLILPAFSPFAAGYSVHKGLPAGLKPWFTGGQAALIAATGNQARRIGVLDPLRFRPAALR